MINVIVGTNKIAVKDYPTFAHELSERHKNVNYDAILITKSVVKGGDMQGRIYNDAADRFYDGDIVYTSPVKSVEKVGDDLLVKTLNTTYLVGVIAL